MPRFKDILSSVGTWNINQATTVNLTEDWTNFNLLIFFFNSNVEGYGAVVATNNNRWSLQVSLDQLGTAPNMSKDYNYMMEVYINGTSSNKKTLAVTPKTNNSNIILHLNKIVGIAY